MTDITTDLRVGGSAPTPSHAQTIVVPTLELAGIAGLATIIAIHATELAGKVDEVAYLGFGYVALIAAAFVAIVMLAVGDRRGWVLAGAHRGGHPGRLRADPHDRPARAPPTTSGTGPRRWRSGRWCPRSACARSPRWRLRRPRRSLIADSHPRPTGPDCSHERRRRTGGPDPGGRRRALDRRRGVHRRCGYEGFEVETAMTGRAALDSIRVSRPRPGGARRDAARPRRLRGRPADARRGDHHADPLPHRQGRPGRQGAGVRPRRGRLRHQAVLAGRDRHAGPGHPPAHRRGPRRQSTSSCGSPTS